MKRKLLLALLLSLGSLSVQTIYGHGVEEEYLMVQQEPPAELEEKVTVSPGPNHVWIKGHWKWVGRWEWIKGHWAEKPHADATWVTGHWIKKPNHWVWVPGHWQ